MGCRPSKFVEEGWCDARVDSIIHQSMTGLSVAVHTLWEGRECLRCHQGRSVRQRVCWRHRMREEVAPPASQSNGNARTLSAHAQGCNSKARKSICNCDCQRNGGCEKRRAERQKERRWQLEIGRQETVVSECKRGSVSSRKARTTLMYSVKFDGSGGNPPTETNWASAQASRIRLSR